MNRHSAERFLTIGLIGAAITVVGELLGGWAPSSDLTNRVTILFSALDAVPIWRIGLCSTVGALGILLQYFGYYGLYLTFDNLETRKARLYRAGNCGFTILGAMFHILCCILMGILKLHPQGAMTFLRWFLLPIFLLFFVGYLITCMVLFWEIARGRTLFPQWACFLNPLTGTLLINLLVLFLPGSAVVNGIGFANMGITSLLLFALFLWQLKASKPAAC